MTYTPMKVEIVIFPTTKVAAVEHRGSPALEHDTARKLIAWKLENRLLDPSNIEVMVFITLIRTQHPI